MVDLTYCTPPRRLLATNGTQGAFSLSPGRVAPSSLTGDLAPLWFPGAPAEGIRYSRAELVAIGTGADNSTFDFKIWLLKGVKTGPLATDWTDAYLKLLGAGTATLSTLTGASGSIVSSTSERYADTLTLNIASESGAGTVASPAGAGRKLLDARGAIDPQVYVHPTANTEPARIIIGNLCDADGLIIEVDLTGATAFNWLVELSR